MMSCEYCNRISGHDCRCPNSVPPKASHYCSICDDGIYDGDEYVENLDGEYVHYECLTDLSNCAIIKWLGGEIRTMEDDDERNY